MKNAIIYKVQVGRGNKIVQDAYHYDPHQMSAEVADEYMTAEEYAAAQALGVDDVAVIRYMTKSTKSNGFTSSRIESKIVPYTQRTFFDIGKQESYLALTK